MTLLKKYSKTTVGFVTQNFEEQEDGKFVCVSQDFFGGDDVVREKENEMGDVSPMLDVGENEIYQPYDMVQPTKEWWVLKLVRYVESSLIGPFETKEKAQERIEEYDADPAYVKDSFTVVSVSKGSEIDVL